jgi:hypothetical protein
MTVRNLYCDLRLKQVSAAVNQRHSSKQGAPRCGSGVQVGAIGGHEHRAAGFYPSTVFLPSRTRDPGAKPRPVRDTPRKRALQRRSLWASRAMRPGTCWRWIGDPKFHSRQRGVQAVLGCRGDGNGRHDGYDCSRNPERSGFVRPIERRQISFCCASIPYWAVLDCIPVREVAR